MKNRFKQLGLAGVLAVLWVANVVNSAPAEAATRPFAPRPNLQWPTLSMGNEGNDSEFVKAVQYLLRARSFWPRNSAIDGIFGGQLDTEAKHFQRAYHLKADGIVGPVTLSRLIIPVKRGSRGDAVRAVQTLCNLNSLNRQILVDGIFGSKTEKTIRNFQSEGKVDGIVGPGTWALLFNYAYRDGD